MDPPYWQWQPEESMGATGAGSELSQLPPISNVWSPDEMVVSLKACPQLGGKEDNRVWGIGEALAEQASISLIYLVHPNPAAAVMYLLSTLVTDHWP